MSTIVKQKRVVSVSKGKVHRLAPFAKKVETRYLLCYYLE